MPKQISSVALIKYLTKKGFDVYSKKGSHVKLISLERNTKTIIPLKKDLPRGTLNAIFKQAKLSKGEIEEILGN